MIPVRILAPLAALSLLAAGCGDSKKPGSATTGSNSATTPATTATTPPPKATTGQAPAVANAKDLASRPQVATPSGDPPTALLKKDLVVGKGPAIKPGQLATVQYLGLSWSTGKVFDASWNRPGQPFQFPVGQGQVIAGWDQGVPGMKVGGRRELVIPGDLGYGAQGTPDGSIAPNETLVFVVDLKRIG